ncbi:hypothetical protein [Streptomyces spongiae]|uniref:hypothetical protein n=1 Tax=Streptomyces spongiae TaxID=565072 RepID=UPI0018847767|nr:hypothetical protein [Streptomyces spongiae]
MADTPSAPLRLIEIEPDGGWCDAETGICTSTAPEPEADAHTGVFTRSREARSLHR